MGLLTAVRAAGNEYCGQERGVSSTVAAGACASKSNFVHVHKALCTGVHGLT